MSAGIKNGKLPTFNILIVFLFSVISFSSGYTKNPDGTNNIKNWIIVIDPGHGGKDPGALGSFSRECDINLAIALKTGEYISQNLKNVTVIYTRKDNTTVNLYERPRIANKANGDLFISIHTNSSPSKKVAGAETWIMGTAKDQANLQVAMTENSVMRLEEDYSTKYEGFDPNSSESYIMFSLTQKAFQEQSTDLASKIQAQFRERVNRNDRDVKQAGFWVLYNTKMPSVLVETGFITNTAEEKYLNSAEGQDYLASAIYRACREYLSVLDSRSGISLQKIPEKGPQAEPDSVTSDTIKPVVFRVQIRSSLTKVDIKPENFKGVKDITEISLPDRYRYVSGSFTDYSEAVIYRSKMGVLYPDAFVIAMQGNKIIPLQQALMQKRKNK